MHILYDVKKLNPSAPQKFYTAIPFSSRKQLDRNFLILLSSIR